MPPPRFKPAPLYPPRHWFTNPMLREPAALTVESSGRIRGHAALWNSAHIGLPNRVTPPREPDYRYFMTGEVVTLDGSLVATGRLSLGGGHADLEKGLRAAQAHYDDVAAAVGDISVGVDRWGIWMAGCLRPDVTEGQVRTLRASSVSADWRSVEGQLRMVAICAVNSAGFPVRRAQVALAASGSPSALVAPGVTPPQAMTREERLRHIDKLIAAIPPEPPQARAERLERQELRQRRQDEFDARLRAFDSVRSHGGR